MIKIYLGETGKGDWPIRKIRIKPRAKKRSVFVPKTTQ